MHQDAGHAICQCAMTCASEFACIASLRRGINVWVLLLSDFKRDYTFSISSPIKNVNKRTVLMT